MIDNCYVCDFETTVDDNTHEQTETEVWAYAITKMYDKTDKVHIGNNIADFMDFWKFGKKKQKKIIYFHNLKFDMTFVLDYLTRSLGYVSAFNETDKKFDKANELKKGTFTTVITDLGIWYVVNVNYEGYQLEFRDSLKVLNFSVKDLGESFKTRHRKSTIDYKGNMAAYGVITDEQKKYISNDVLVVREALELFFDEMKITRPPLTISQFALNTFKKQFDKTQWKTLFPNLCEIRLDPDIYGSSNADEYVRRSYTGGWCYADERFTGIVNGETTNFDVNSLYPSCMAEPKNDMPVGMPIFTKKTEDLRYAKYYFIRFKCKFELRSGYLPFIQLKHDPNYRMNENLKSSKYDRFGNRIPDHRPELTLSRTTFQMFGQAYKITDFEFLDACIFETESGFELFGQYVNHFMEMKIQATKDNDPVRRQSAKILLNALYGRFGRNPQNLFKVVKFDDNTEMVKYLFEQGEELKPLYIPIACAITSFARKFTISAAILNFETFRYSDTDSLKLVLNGKKPNAIKEDNTALSCWKNEGVTQHSIFLRQKTYMEFDIDNSNMKKSTFDVKACGMPERSKILFIENLKGNKPLNNCLYYRNSKGRLEKMKLSVEELEFMEQDLTINDFKVGLCVPGKLMPRVIKGGTVLEEVDFTIK